MEDEFAPPPEYVSRATMFADAASQMRPELADRGLSLVGVYQDSEEVEDMISANIPEDAPIFDELDQKNTAAGIDRVLVIIEDADNREQILEQVLKELDALAKGFSGVQVQESTSIKSAKPMQATVAEVLGRSAPVGRVKRLLAVYGFSG